MSRCERHTKSKAHKSISVIEFTVKRFPRNSTSKSKFLICKDEIVAVKQSGMSWRDSVDVVLALI